MARRPLVRALGAADLDVVIWPFSGRLHDLFRRGRVVVAETYPAECYGYLGVDLRRGTANGKSGKRQPRSRVANAGALLAWARSADIVLTPALVAVIEDGFGTSEHGEDQFDAVVGLLGMLNVPPGGRPPGEPADERSRRVEGWILGQAHKGDMSGPFFVMRNKHTPTGSEPPAITNEVEGQYFGYFENRHGEQWVFAKQPITPGICEI